MSTNYVLFSDNDIELCANESNHLVRLGMWEGDHTYICSTSNTLTDNDLISIIVNLAKVASYITNDPGSIPQRVMLAMKEVRV